MTITIADLPLRTRWRSVMDMVVDGAVRMGINRAYKYSDAPRPSEEMVESLVRDINYNFWVEFEQWFEEENGIDVREGGGE